ncbi:hypothetical protein DFR29_11155 [Tahibacter aquaticus]|uniref:Uncharacterized protein n=1 Tax=Tahibacter aquaticus TaxID=520092 RepID=A0A4R6YSH6_9GAMM|nr:ankyrin repeat domain-containing protein [Tahibacter aquaticus]TDR41143.1 hypothetical protein DFR29_11155 [Tahibacter aquaticus]
MRILFALLLSLLAATAWAQPGTGTLDAASVQHYLFDAARAGKTDLVADLLKAGAPVDAANGAGHTALILAVYNGRLDTADTLLKAGADPNLGDRRGNTALMGAIFKGEESLVQRLLADPRTRVDARNGAGQTAAMFAALFGKRSVIEQLAARGADFALADAAGQTAQKLALQQGNGELAAYLQQLSGKPRH